MASLSAPESGPKLSSVESSKLIVSQPKQLKNVLDLLSTLDAVETRISERTGEDRSGDWSGAGTGGSTQGDDKRAVSARDQAIKNLPVAAIMQKQLQVHIENEIHDLSRQAKNITRANKPGAAHRLNEIYARIRRLNALLSELLRASVDVVKRLFVRVFVDKQPVL